MNVSLQNIDKVSAELTVKLEKADYQEKVDKELKSLRQKAQIPGFRKGMVPTSLIKKMYGKSVIAEVVNKTLQEAVYNYIKENKVNMLGEPLPNEEKQQNIDFDTMDEFDFVFDIALAPEFKAEVSTKDKVDYYTIEVSDEMIDNQVKMYTQRTGKYDKVDAYEDNDMLKGLLAQLDEEGNTKEGGIQVEGAVLMPSYMKNDDQKAIFANAKVNDVLVFNPNVAYDGHAAELGSLLKIDKEIAKDVKSNFSFQVEEITRFVPGELTQEVFDQAFGEGVVKTEEEFRAKIKEEIAARFVADSDYKFLIDVRKVLMDKVGKLEFPDDVKPVGSIPRQGGRFYWQQLSTAMLAGAEMIYVAMFDEVDEGTAIFKCTGDHPVSDVAKFIDMDGQPSDHYLWLTGEAARMLRKETPLTFKMPVRE